MANPHDKTPPPSPPDEPPPLPTIVPTGPAPGEVAPGDSSKPPPLPPAAFGRTMETPLYSAPVPPPLPDAERPPAGVARVSTQRSAVFKVEDQRRKTTTSPLDNLSNEPGSGEVERTRAQPRPVRDTQGASRFAAAARPPFTVHGVATPMLGRRAELEKTYNAVREALNYRRVTVVEVLGEAGLGKSRLVHEIITLVDPERRGIAVVRALAGPGRRGTRVSLAARLIGDVVGLTQDIPRSAAWPRLLDGLSKLMDPRRAREIALQVQPLLGLPPPAETPPAGLDAGLGGGLVAPPEIDERRAASVAGSLVQARARRSPLLLVVEQADRSSVEDRDALQALAASLDGLPVAIVLVGRAAIAGFEIPPALRRVSVVLAPLPEREMGELAHRLLSRTEGLPDDLFATLVARADGNPRLLEELVRVLVGKGVLSVTQHRWRFHADRFKADHLPSSFGESRQQRIESLDGRLRAVLDRASIFGSTFWFGGVLSMMRAEGFDNDQALEEERDRLRLKNQLLTLQSKELVHFSDKSWVSGDLEFSFVEDNDRQTLYGALPAKDRLRLHRLAAQWLVGRDVQDVSLHGERTASHYEAGEMSAQAAAAYLRAGEAARNVGQLARAREMFQRGLSLVTSTDALVACDLATALGGTCLRFSEHDTAESALRQALRHALILDDDERAGLAKLRLGQVARSSGNYEQGVELVDRAYRHFQAAAGQQGLASAMDELGHLKLLRGGPNAYREALEHFLKALSLRRKASDRRGMARTLAHVARVHLGRGHIEDADAAARECIEICREQKDKWGLGDGLIALGDVHLARGDARAATEEWTETLRLAEDLGDRARRAEVSLRLAEAATRSGDYAGAGSMLVEALDLAREIGDRRAMSGGHRGLAALALSRGELSHALAESEKAVSVARSLSARAPLAAALKVHAAAMGVRSLQERGARAAAADREATECFEEAAQAYEEMGELPELQHVVSLYLEYLAKRGAGPRHEAVRKRLERIKRETAKVTGALPDGSGEPT